MKQNQPTITVEASANVAWDDYNTDDNGDWLICMEPISRMLGCTPHRIRIELSREQRRGFAQTEIKRCVTAGTWHARDVTHSCGYAPWRILTGRASLELDELFPDERAPRKVHALFFRVTGVA